MFVRRCVYALFAVLAFVAVAQQSSAQVSVYGVGSLTAFGFTGSNYPTSGSFKGDTFGVTGGAFYNFHSSSRLKAGVDGRMMYAGGYKGGQAYTGAFRISFVPTHNPLRPYFQIGGGVATTQLHTLGICSPFSCGTVTTRYTSGIAQIVFGLDIRTTPHVDIRALDYGADAGGSSAEPHAAAAFLGAGAVYHF